MTALLDETEDCREEESEIADEEDPYPEDSLHGQSIILRLLAVCENIFLLNHNNFIHEKNRFKQCFFLKIIYFPFLITCYFLFYVVYCKSFNYFLSHVKRM